MSALLEAHRVLRLLAYRSGSAPDGLAGNNADGPARPL